MGSTGEWLPPPGSSPAARRSRIRARRAAVHARAGPSATTLLGAGAATRGRSPSVLSPLAPMAQIGVNTGTRAPSSKKVSSSTPSTGAVRSKLVLSVSISAIRSPALTSSPLCLCHVSEQAIFDGVAKLRHFYCRRHLPRALPYRRRRRASTAAVIDTCSSLTSRSPARSTVPRLNPWSHQSNGPQPTVALRALRRLRGLPQRCSSERFQFSNEQNSTTVSRGLSTGRPPPGARLTPGRRQPRAASSPRLR